MKFRDLAIGQTFDFVDDANPGYNSFFHRCVKTGKRTYKSLETGMRCTVGTINCNVFHVS